MFPTAQRISKLLLRTILILLFSFTGGLTASVLAQAVAPERQVSYWYEHPAVVAAFATSLCMLLAKMLEKWWDSRKDQKAEKRQEQNTHLSLAQQIEELRSGELLSFIEKRDELHADQLEFLRQQVITLEVGKYEYKEKHLAAMNEITRLNAAVVDRQRLLDKAGVNYEPIATRSYFEILEGAGIAEKVAAFSQQLENRHAALLQREKDKEG